MVTFFYFDVSINRDRAMAAEHELTEQRNERFLKLLEPIHSDCQRWAYNLAQDKTIAEDVFSQSILTGLEHIHQLKNEDAFKTWMFRIIRNTHLLWLRSNKRQADPVDPDVLSGISHGGESHSQQADRESMVQQALEKLSPEQRQGLVLFHLEQLSIKDIAQVMGKKQSAVRVLLHRARQRFELVLKDIEGLESVV